MTTLFNKQILASFTLTALALVGCQTASRNFTALIDSNSIATITPKTIEFQPLSNTNSQLGTVSSKINPVFTVAAKTVDPQTLRVALLPDESPSSVIKNNEGLKKYLETKLNKKIQLFVTTDYSSMIEAVRNKRVDLAYFGPLSYVLAKTKSDIEPFAALKKDGKTTYRAVVIANISSGVNTLKAAKGKTVAFGDQASTSSHLIPKSMLKAVGLVHKKDYQEAFTGSHDAVAIAVQNGNAQVGGLSQPIYQSLIEKKVISPAKVKVIAESKDYPQYPWTMRSDLKPELKVKIRSAFIGLKDKNVLKPFKAEGFGAINDRDYNSIRELAKILNLDLAKVK